MPKTATRKRKIVHKIEDGMDRQEVELTTYQMRNFYRQLGDGFFSPLDTMNYAQHHQIVRWCKPGNRVLDLCCGRGLMLPLLRYHAPTIGSYTGVDIEAKNAVFHRGQRVTDGKPVEPDDYYPFPVKFVQANVKDLPLPDRAFDVVIYTSSIEHMHPEAGKGSLFTAARVTVPGGLMVITCPRTPEDQDGYDTQYRAHVYEWKLSELRDALAAAGWEVITEYGLLAPGDQLVEWYDARGMGPVVDRIRALLPREWWLPVLSVPATEISKEVGLLCKRVI